MSDHAPAPLPAHWELPESIVRRFGINNPEEVLQLRSFWIVLGVGIIAGFIVLGTLSLRMRKK